MGLEPTRPKTLVPKTSASTVPPPGHFYFCTEGGIRTHTDPAVQGILSPPRLPLRHLGINASHYFKPTLSQHSQIEIQRIQQKVFFQRADYICLKSDHHTRSACIPVPYQSLRKVRMHNRSDVEGFFPRLTECKS